LRFFSCFNPSVFFRPIPDCGVCSPVFYGKLSLADPATDIFGTDSIPIYFTDGGSASFRLICASVIIL
jgi:hypothetical protein